MAALNAPDRRPEWWDACLAGVALLVVSVALAVCALGTLAGWAAGGWAF